MRKVLYLVTLLFVAIGGYAKEDKSLELQKDLNKYFVGLTNYASKYVVRGEFIDLVESNYYCWDTTFTTPGDTVLLTCDWSYDMTWYIPPSSFKDTTIRLQCWGGSVDTTIHTSYKAWTDTIYPYLRDIMISQEYTDQYTSPLDMYYWGEVFEQILDTVYDSESVEWYPKKYVFLCCSYEENEEEEYVFECRECGVCTSEYTKEGYHNYGGRFQGTLDSINYSNERQIYEIQKVADRAKRRDYFGYNNNATGPYSYSSQSWNPRYDGKIGDKMQTVNNFDVDYRMKTGCEDYENFGNLTNNMNAYSVFNRPFFRTRVHSEMTYDDIYKYDSAALMTPPTPLLCGSDKNVESTTVSQPEYQTREFYHDASYHLDTTGINPYTFLNMFHISQRQPGWYYCDREMLLYVKTFDPANLIFKHIRFSQDDRGSKPYKVSKDSSLYVHMTVLSPQVSFFIAGYSTTYDLVTTSTEFKMFRLWLKNWRRPTDLYHKNRPNIESPEADAGNDLIGGMRQTPQSMAYKEFQIKMNQWTNARINSQSYFSTWAEHYLMDNSSIEARDIKYIKKLVGDCYKETGDTTWVTRAKNLTDQAAIQLILNVANYVKTRIQYNDIPLLYYTTDNFTWQREMVLFYLIYEHTWN